MKSWIALIAVALLAGGAVVAQQRAAQAEEQAAGEKPTELLRHVVLLKLKAETPAEKVKEIETEFAGLASKIDEIADLEWGTDSSPEGLAQGFTHCFFVTFDSEADRDAYLPHAAHQAFVEILKPHVEQVLVIDYTPREK